MSIQHLHDVLRTSHIVLGGCGLLLFWVPALTRKGSPMHVLSGRCFNYVAFAIAATAAVSCLWAMTAPLSFTGITRELSNGEQATLFGNVRFLFVILFTLMTWLVSGVTMGAHVARHKLDFRIDSRATSVAWRVSSVTSLACGVFGANLLYLSEINGLLPLFLAWVGFSDASKNLQLLREPAPSPHLWREKHIECMIGSGIAMHTAFFVFGAKRLFGIQLEGLTALVPWFLPTVVGVIAISMLIRQHRRDTNIPVTSECEPDVN